MSQVKRFKSHGIDTIIIGSQGEPYAVQFPNSPLADKWNFGLSLSKRYDYVLLMGSDDFISDEGIEIYKEQMERGIDFIYMKDFYFYDGELFYWPGYFNEREGEPTGTMRCVSNILLEAVDWKLWGGNDISLDKQSYKSINMIAHTHSVVSDVFAVGIKHEYNIYPRNKIPNLKKVDIKLMNNIPEYEQIKKLVYEDKMPYRGLQ